LTDSGDKEKNKTLIGIDQRMVNQKDLSQIEIEVIPPEMIEANKGVSDAAKRSISKEIVWQKISICTMRKKMTKMLI